MQGQHRVDRIGLICFQMYCMTQLGDLHRFSNSHNACGSCILTSNKIADKHTKKKTANDRHICKRGPEGGGGGGGGGYGENFKI